MIPFEFVPVSSIDHALSIIDHTSSVALAGGTTMLDLMKLHVLTPTRLVHVTKHMESTVRLEDDALRIGAGCTMADLADDTQVVEKLPAIRQSLILAASPQIRNMATIGGNLMQRTRSTYFRHRDMPSDAAVASDSVAVASDGQESFGQGVDTSCLAVLGNDGKLVGTYPGDFAVALVAFDAQLTLQSNTGTRSVPLRDFYQLPRSQSQLLDSQSQYTTVLQPHELIASVSLPITAALRNSLYLKVRERSSYAFALASAAIGLELNGQGASATIVAANVGLGGLGPIPWHSVEAEQALIGRVASDATFQAAADAALAAANPPAGLEFKIPLAKRIIVRALQMLRDQGPLNDQQLWALQHGRG